jgi:hypothetical protein
MVIILISRLNNIRNDVFEIEIPSLGWDAAACEVAGRGIYKHNVAETPSYTFPKEGIAHTPALIFNLSEPHNLNPSL